MEILLKLDAANQLRLPVTPADLTIQSGQQNQSVQVTQVGEIALWGPEKLEAFTLQSFFPLEDNAPYAEYTGYPTSWECVEIINNLRRSGKPIRFIMSDKRLDIDINMEIIIETFDYTLKDASGDVYYSLTVKKYKKVTMPSSKSPDAPVLSRSVPSSKETSGSNKTYTVKSGDTLWGIAKKQYGNGSKYIDIYNANKDKLKDPNVIKVGQVLIIP